jgi:4-aminobutyrate aminotransferase
MPTLESVRADLPNIVTALPGLKAKTIISRDTAVMSPSYTRSYPLVVARGEGAMLEDVDGNRFLDCNAGIAVCSTGHSHPKVVEAIREQAGKFLHMSGTDFYYENMVRLAEKLAALAPRSKEEGSGPKRVLFQNSGTEAIEAALKLARFHTKRQQFVAFFGGFHGRTMGSLSLTGSKSVQQRGFFPTMPGVHHTPYPYFYRSSAANPDACAMDAIRNIEDVLFRHKVAPDDVAAFVVEPIQGEGGYVVPPRKFFDELRRLADKYGILIIADEVQSGMGRTGKMFASEHFGLVPDIIAIAKGIASGMPLGAIITRDDVMDWGPGAHASTFGGNPVCVAAALATIELLERELMANTAKVGAHMKSRLEEFPKKFKIVGDVRGLGLMIGIEIVRDPQTKERAPDLRDKIEYGCFERGLLVLGAGPNTIRICPPLVISKDQADFAVDTLAEVIGQIS